MIFVFCRLRVFVCGAVQCSVTSHRLFTYDNITCVKIRTYLSTRQPALIFPSRSPTPHFGDGTQGAMSPKFELGRVFCTIHLLLQISSSYVYSFGSYRVDKQTNKQTDQVMERRHRKTAVTSVEWQLRHTDSAAAAVSSSSLRWS